MKPLLTTITPYWNRPTMLRGWADAVAAATTPEVQHLVYFVGEKPSVWWGASNFCGVHRPEDKGRSIGYFHNLGATHADSEWIMKLDVDTVPNVRYFAELLPILRATPARAWLNGGMVCLSKMATERLEIPLSARAYGKIMSEPKFHTTGTGWFPQATNFICRRADYLRLGGSDARFSNYGWEDYQQIYMLERDQLGRDPLPGVLTLGNVTHRCRDEISRRKARELAESNRWLVLLHRWHEASPDPAYRNPGQLDRNRAVLFDYVTARRGASY